MIKMSFQDYIDRYYRTGALDKAKWLETIDQKIPKSYKERIAKGDKSVLQELILPKWVTWEMLVEWVKEEKKGEVCVICGKVVDNYITIHGKVVCMSCITEIKKLTSGIET